VRFHCLDGKHRSTYNTTQHNTNHTKIHPSLHNTLVPEGRCKSNFTQVRTEYTANYILYMHICTWADWKVLRLLLFLFPGIRRGNAILGFVKVIQWRFWTCIWTTVAFSIWSQRVEAPSTFCYGGWGRHLCENTAEVCDWILSWTWEEQ